MNETRGKQSGVRLGSARAPRAVLRAPRGTPGLIPSLTNKVTTKDAKSAKEDKEDPLQIFASFARFVVTSLLSF